MHLNTLNLSYNELTSDNLSKYIFQITKEFLRINLFDLRGNLIDNRFLNNFNHKAYEELRNSIQEKLSGNNLTNNYICIFIYQEKGNILGFFHIMFAFISYFFKIFNISHMC